MNVTENIYLVRHTLQVANFQNRTVRRYRPKDITFLTSDERLVFLILFAILLTISLGGNVAAIAVTIRSNNHRFIQKIGVVSLALSDLIMTAAYCTNNMETFSHPMINWTLGHWLCSFLPMAQIFGLMLNLASMLVIAIDRYVNIVQVLAHRWNPPPLRCILGFTLVWITCMGVSYPIYPMFKVRSLKVFDDEEREQHEHIVYKFCITNVKDALEQYYISIAVLVFSTLWGCVLFLNYRIARIVRPHRLTANAIADVEHAPSSAKPSLIFSVESFSTPARQHKLRHLEASRHARRMRAFRIVVGSMLLFTLCRLPFWLFNIMKVTFVNTKKHHWLMLYGFNALALLNCAINPFVHAFLQPTARVLSKLWHFLEDFAQKICCWYCTASEFDEFGKENPFCPQSDGSKPLR